MEEQDQEQQNKSDGFLKQQKNKGKEIAKDEAKKQVKNKVKTMIMKNPKVALIVLAVIVALILIVVLLAGAVYLINYFQEKEGSQAKEATISFALSGNTEEVESAEQKKITIIQSEEGNYKINVNYTEEEFEELEKKQTEIVDFSKFTDFEKSVIFALNENGLNLSDYTEDQLKCLPAFIKAEGTTQYLDLRENKDKQSGKKVGDYIDKYEPVKREDLEEDEIPGTVLVQRTNTAEEDPVTLQYIEQEKFKKMIEDNDIEATNYFTMNDKKNLVVATWRYKKIEVSGAYPDTVAEDQREQEIEETILAEKEIEYSRYLQKYTMPFDFLLQLLVNGEDPKFCLDLVDIVLDSKIIINIQEEETKTHRVQVSTYDEHTKENKYIEYQVGNNAESGTNIFLKETKDDEKNDCTTYNKKTFKVTVTTDTTSHSYKPEIIEVDTWIAHYKNEYDAPEKKVTNSEIDPQDVKEKYKQISSIQKSRADAEADPHAAKFKKQKEAQYKSKNPVIPENTNSINNNADKVVQCNINRLAIVTHQKTNLRITTTEEITKYETDPEPKKTVKLYAKDEDGNLEKFLKVFHENRNARELIHSIENWLFESMEENKNTSYLVDIIKYLLYIYDGTDRGVTELDIEDIMNPESFRSVRGLYGASLEEKVWWALIDAGYSKEAAAGAMGNFYGESGFRTNNLEDTFETILGYTDESYTDAVNNDTYTRETFISDHTSNNCGAGYGLAQWTWETRKAGLYDFAKAREVSIDDENMQIEYLLGELSYSGGADGYATYQLQAYKGYTTDDWINATTPEAAAVAFCWIFEKPTHYDSVRSSKARQYYEEFKDKERLIGGDILQVAADLHELLKDNMYAARPRW